MPDTQKWTISRRKFLKSTVSVAAGAIAGAGALRSVSAEGLSAPQSLSKKKLLHFGIMADTHYADIDSRGERHYRASVGKMIECVDLMNDKKVDFLAHLGDFKNGAPEGNIDNLKYAESLFARFHGPRYHVLGNHDMDQLSKEEFQAHIVNTGIDPAHTYYSFNRGGVHFVVLDANFRNDGVPYKAGNYRWTECNIPDSQLQWLDEDLKSAGAPSIIFTHQLLDGEGDHYIRNASEVRKVLERHSGVMAVFQGHQHRGQYNLINSIHYYTLRAMVVGPGEEDSAYAVVRVYDDLSIDITGYRKAVTMST